MTRIHLTMRMTLPWPRRSRRVVSSVSAVRARLRHLVVQRNTSPLQSSIVVVPPPPQAPVVGPSRQVPSLPVNPKRPAAAPTHAPLCMALDTFTEELFEMEPPPSPEVPVVTDKGKQVAKKSKR